MKKNCTSNTMSDYFRIDSADTQFHIDGYERLRSSVMEPVFPAFRNGLAVLNQPWRSRLDAQFRGTSESAMSSAEHNENIHTAPCGDACVGGYDSPASSSIKQNRDSMMKTEQKVTSSHLQRDAWLYVRQSTLRQVMENTESTERQYALRERAVALGWPIERIHVIDEDLGESGASQEREGFAN